MFSRLVRFKADDGQIYYGDAKETWEENLRGREVESSLGSDPFNLKLTGKKPTVSEVSSRQAMRGPSISDWNI